MGSVALDANVVIGFLGRTDAHHARALETFRELDRTQARLQMAASAYAEVLVQPLRDGRASVVEDFIRHTRIEVMSIDRDTARSAGELCARFASLRLGDAMVLASARAGEVDLLTFDDRLARIAREVR